MQIHEMPVLAGGPTWQIIAVSLIGLLIVIATAYIKSLERRLIQAEKDIVAVNKLVLRDYHNKEELNRILTSIQSSVVALHRRFDREFSKSGFHTQNHEDE